MSHPRMLDISKVALLIVDVQEAFRNVIGDFERLAARCGVAARGFITLGRPIFITEQYPKGLGRTAAEIADVLPGNFDYIEKTAFSSCGAQRLVDGFRSAGVEQIVVCGLETHVCVNQTVHDLLDRKFAVHLLTDCVVSRFDNDREVGLTKMLSSGAIPSSVEMAFFEMMRDARHENFKVIQALIK